MPINSSCFLLVVDKDWVKTLSPGCLKACASRILTLFPLARALELEFQWSPLSRASSILTILSKFRLTSSGKDHLPIDLPLILHNRAIISSIQREEQPLSDESQKEAQMDERMFGPSMSNDKGDGFPKL